MARPALTICYQMKHVLFLCPALLLVNSSTVYIIKKHYSNIQLNAGACYWYLGNPSFPPVLTTKRETAYWSNGRKKLSTNDHQQQQQQEMSLHCFHANSSIHFQL